VSRAVDPGTLGGAHAAATQAMQQVASIVAAGDYRSLGFANSGDINQATLGTPIRMVFLPLDRLSAYEDGQDPVATLEDSEGLIFPILVNGAVTSGVFLAKVGTGWKMVGLGQPERVKLMEQTRNALAAANNVDKASLFAVKALGLDLTFIGRVQDGKLLVTPIEDMPTFGLTANQEVRAETALHNLSPAARTYEPIGVR
jgi:hypothetical protein